MLIRMPTLNDEDLGKTLMLVQNFPEQARVPLRQLNPNEVNKIRNMSAYRIFRETRCQTYKITKFRKITFCEHN